MTVNKQYFTMIQVRNALEKIADRMAEDNWEPDVIMGINRGGCIPGIYLSHRLNKPHEALDVRLRDHKAKPDLRNLEKAYAFQKKILIIDDINDTGATFNWIKKDWQEACLPNSTEWNTVWGNNVRWAVLTDNLASKFEHKINYTCDEVNKAEEDVWLVYPWENVGEYHA